MDEKGYVNKSGFPLQIGLRHSIETTNMTHGWKVVAEEYPWEHPDYHNHGFIDLILESGLQRIIIECKRVRDTKWIFLIPANARCRSYTQFCKSNKNSFFWTGGNFDPSSHEAQFCIVPGQDPKSKPMLERTAAELILATEAVASEELRMGKYGFSYIPIIITTANLRVCKYKPGNISIEKGEIDTAATFETVPFMRFRKSFVLGTGCAESLAESARKLEKTVFVVNAGHFVDFLREQEYC